MASTNKTTNYELSQYIGTDKPTYLTDYNQDMSKIDAGIHAAKSEADTNASAIGTLSSLTTETKSTLVGAINEVDAHADTNAGNIATNTSNIATNTTHIGTLANLTTASKTDLVVAANEINAKVGNVSNLETNNKTSTVAAINELVEKFNLTTFKTFTNSDMTFSGCSYKSGSITLASNEDYSVIKLYGDLRLDTDSSSWSCTVTVNNVIPTGYRPTEDITINPAGVLLSGYESARVNVIFNTDGSVTISMPKGTNQSITVSAILIPFIIFLKDFGDVPSPSE